MNNNDANKLALEHAWVLALEHKNAQEQYCLIFSEMWKVLGKFYPETLELISEYDDKHHNAGMQYSIMDMIKDFLDMQKEMNLEDELGGQYE
jgi:hypothetical protein